MDHTSYSITEVSDFYSSGKIHLLSAIELFSRYLWSWIVKYQKNDTVLKFINTIKGEFASLKVIKSDNGKAFKSNDVRDLCEQLNISQTFTFPFNPRSNGAVERSHGSVKDLFSRECRHEKSKKGEHLMFEELNEILQKCIKVLNRSKSSITTMKPIDLLGKVITDATKRKIYDRHISKNRSKFCDPEPVFIGSADELELFQNTYYLRCPSPDTLSELSNLLVLAVPKPAFLDSRHVLKGERVCRYTQFQLERHRRNKKPNLAIDCEIVASKNKY